MEYQYRPKYYFGGDASNLGKVKRLPPKNFKELVSSTLNMAVVLNLTREEYWAKTKKERSSAKKVPFIVPSTYALSEGMVRRDLESATGISLVCLDIDDSEMARPYYSSPDLLYDQLEGLNFAIYETASSTPEHPRVRILVDANIRVDEYRKAVDTIASMIGLSKVNQESYTACLPMFLPTIFQDDEEIQHPLLYNYAEGKEFTSELLVDSQPAILDELGGDEKVSPFDAFDKMDFLQPPVEAVTIREASKMLAHLDADMSYPDWLVVAAGLKHQFAAIGQIEEEQAFELFDEWSQLGEKYVGEEDTKAKWRSLKANPSRTPVTIRSLMKMAKEHGWDSTELQGACYENTLAWINAGCEDAKRMLKEGVRRIAATPMLEQTEEEMLLNILVNQLRKQFKMKVSLPMIRKELAREKTRGRIDKRKEKPPSYPKWTMGICFVEAIDMFYRPKTQNLYSPSAVDKMYARLLLPTDEDLEGKGDDSIVARSRPHILPRDYLLNIVKCPCVYDLMYDPSRPNDQFIGHKGLKYVNNYVRTYPEPDESQSKYAGEVAMEHMDKLFGEDEEYKSIVLDFVAHMVQTPGKRIRWAILLQGAQGCGKSFIAEMASRVLGRGHVSPLASEAIKGQWNDWAEGRQLIAIEEIRVAGQNRHEVMNKLKPLITNDFVNINRRFKDSRAVENFTNYILFTNHHDALVLSEDDRRYCVMQSVLQTREQVSRLGDEYFAKLFGMLETHAKGLRHWFENYEISDSFNPNGAAPRTRHMDELMVNAKSELHVKVEDMITTGESALVTEECISARVVTNAAELEGIRVSSPSYVAAILREMGYRFIDRRTLKDEQRHSIWIKNGSSYDIDDAVRMLNKGLSGEALDEDEEDLI